MANKWHGYNGQSRGIFNHQTLGSKDQGAVNLAFYGVLPGAGVQSWLQGTGLTLQVEGLEPTGFNLG